MLSFVEYLQEFRTTDLEYFKHLPDTTPPDSVAVAQKRFGLADHIKWKSLTTQSIHQSEELDDGIIAMQPGDRLENWFHELGHEVFDHSDKESIKPLLTRVRDTYRVHNRDYAPKYQSRVKQIELGGNWYGYSHSGKEFEFDELFAVSFAFVMTGGHFDQPDIEMDYQKMLNGLERKDAGEIKSSQGPKAASKCRAAVVK